MRGAKLIVVDTRYQWGEDELVMELCFLPTGYRHLKMVEVIDSPSVGSSWVVKLEVSLVEMHRKSFDSCRRVINSRI